MIRITAQRNAFRRAGIAHSATPTEYPDDAFTPEQLDALTAEPMLLVEFVSDQPAASAVEVAASEVAETPSVEEMQQEIVRAVTQSYLPQDIPVTAMEIPAVAQTANPPVAAVREDDEPAEAELAPKRSRRKKGE